MAGSGAPPVISRKIAVVTGATSGIGEVTARRLASQGAFVVLVGHDVGRGRAALERIRTLVPSAQLDLVTGDLAERVGVDTLAAELTQRYPRIDVLVNNAGAIYARREVTRDGVERTWALNVVAPFRLTRGLEGSLRAAGYARVVNVASDAHRGQHLDFADLEGAKGYSGYRAYGRSKLALLVWTFELARRWSGTGVTVNAVHPGFVRTGFAQNNGGAFAGVVRFVSYLFAVGPEVGADTPVFAAVDPSLEGRTGLYLVRETATLPSPDARNVEDGPRLVRLLEAGPPSLVRPVGW
ncbi:MAG: SDR family oxidoreductase [Thermoplasmata archaeon]